MHAFELQREPRQEPSKQQDGSELLLLTEHSDLYSQQTPAPIPQQVRTWLLTLSGLLLLPVALSVAALALSATQLKHAGSSSSTSSSFPSNSSTIRVAFGSCTAYDLRPQPIWTEGVVPSAPHAWLWLGDMAYMDDPLVDCHSTDAGFPECSCAADWLRAPPTQCFAGDPVHAQKRMQQQLLVPEYRSFLAYMCPGYEEQGVFPPIGTDPGQCRYLLSGVYDDHDSGWNNGDGRNPAKVAIKTIYLDGIGEPPSSPRRSSMNGLQTRYTLRSTSLLIGAPPGSGAGQGQGQGQGQQGSSQQDVDMVLLDGRWYRETMPCSRRREACAAALNSSEVTGWRAWCEDFLISGGPGKTGSCCRKDDEWDAWCGAASTSHPLWAVLCDPTSSLFANQQLLLGPDNTTVLPNTPGLWDTPGDQWLRLLEASTSPMCEVLGAPQRSWLADVLTDSPAPVKLIASGSVLLPSRPARGPAACSGDDWACWRRAQLNVLHTLANTSTGCPVVLVGDYHYSDLKAVLPGQQQPYAAELRSARLRKPVYQVMSSGLTTSTARSAGQPCRGSLQEDLLGTRLLGPCSYVPQPAFGMVEVDWAAQVMTLSIRNGSTGGVANGVDGKLQQLKVSLQDCQLL